MVFSSFTTTVAVLIRNRHSGFKLNGPFADSPSVPAKDFFGKALASIAEKFDDLSQRYGVYSPEGAPLCFSIYQNPLHHSVAPVVQDDRFIANFVCFSAAYFRTKHFFRGPNV
jgi:hypothetical protein